MTDARRKRSRLRLADEGGIGLVELLIAMTLLAIGIAAAMAVFASSIVSLQRSGHEGTAITLADRQLETYRTMPFSCFPSSLPGSAPSGCQTYTAGTFPNPYDATHTTSSSESPGSPDLHGHDDAHLAGQLRLEQPEAGDGRRHLAGKQHGDRPGVELLLDRRRVRRRLIDEHEILRSAPSTLPPTL